MNSNLNLNHKTLRAVLATLVAAMVNTAAQPAVMETELDIVADELIVQFDPAASPTSLADAVRRAGLTVKKHLPAGGRKREHSGLALMKTPLPLAQALAALHGHPAIRYAEPNIIKKHQATSNDPNYLNAKLWGMYGDATSPANPFGSQAGEAWAAGNIGSTEIYVAVLDQGIDINHPDLALNIGRNPGEIPGNGIDDDTNGYVDDVYGYDFINNDNTVYDGGKDKDNHGTHVAGTIGATGGNGLGVAGVCWSVRILAGKFLGFKGGTVADEVEAIEYFIDLKQRHGLNLIAFNASYGGGSSLTEQIAIIRAAKAGILLVASAGNNGNGTAGAPARYDTSLDALNPDGTVAETGAGYDAVLSIAALASNGSLPSWSGSSATRVDLAAPGDAILSTLPGAKYGLMSGTSMAAPHVTGACVLYVNAFPGATPWEIKSAILASTIPTPSLAGKTVTGGRLNVSGFYAQ
jgi:subtilisin family serine protease